MRGGWRRSTPWRLAPLALLLTLLLSACAAPFAASGAPSPVPAAATHTPTANTYTDAKLGFRITLPTGWAAQPEPGQRAAPSSSAVTLVDTLHTGTFVLLSIIRSPTMPAAFAQRGPATARIGPYPAFIADNSTQLGRVPCLIRLFLAQTDYAVAEECASDAPTHAAQLEQMLATYQPPAPGYTPPAALHQPPQQTCADVLRASGYDPAHLAWGHTLATPTATSPDGGWDTLRHGVYLCNNHGSTDPYLFQCTELVNRYDWEQWALPRFTDHSELYFDYYASGMEHPGQVRTLFPAGTYALASDASQAPSAFAPQPGDLLVFQDVNHARQGWTSGIRAGTLGHVALITGVDATHVYVAQENYNQTQYFLALPLTHTATGWRITDLSGVPNRIVRGWIHFAAE